MAATRVPLWGSPTNFRVAYLDDPLDKLAPERIRNYSVAYHLPATATYRVRLKPIATPDQVLPFWRFGLDLTKPIGAIPD